MNTRLVKLKTVETKFWYNTAIVESKVVELVIVASKEFLLQILLKSRISVEYELVESNC